VIEIIFHGTGGQGVVIAAKLLADAVTKSGGRAQSFAAYGGERRGGRVESYLRISEEEIPLHCKVYEPDYVIIMNESLAQDPAVVSGIKDGGGVLINSPEPPESFPSLGNLSIQTIDANRIAAENGVLLPSGLPVISTTIIGAVAALVPKIGIEELAEAERCFHCGNCDLCENCYIFCPDIAVTFDDKICSFTIDRNLCKGCGICIAECPRNAISWEDGL